MRAEDSVDVVVIGAGIVGAACAWRIAQAGASVIVVEREAAPAYGSTGRSVAGVRHQFSEPANVLLSLHSIREYRDMPEAGYRPIGYLFLVPQALWATQRRDAQTQRELGAPVRVLSTREANAIVAFDGEGIAGATWCDEDGIVDPHGICMEFVKRARSQRVRVLLGQEVVAIEGAGSSWRIDTRDRSLRAATVVNAAGAWSGQVASLAGLDVPVEPARRIVFATGPLPQRLRRARPYPLTVDLASGTYFRSEGERLLFGRSNPADRGLVEGIDWEWLESVYPDALARFPWFDELTLDRRASWWGYYDMTPDGNPILGRMPGTEGWINACGFSGHGVQHAAAVGRVIAAEATGQAPFIDIDPLRYERFTGAGAARSRDGAERLVI